eukprot:PITA_33516
MPAHLNGCYPEVDMQMNSARLLSAATTPGSVDPFRVELDRLQNQLKDKDRELGDAQAEIKALKLTERLKEKAVEELTGTLGKLEEKLKTNEALLESKNLEIKKLNDEKKAALATQFAVESALRRVYAAQKDEDMIPLEALLAPFEAEIKATRHHIILLQEDYRALERLTKSKEAALLEAEKSVQVAQAKADMVDDLQNKNQELTRQLEICQEENKIIDRMHRVKISEVERLSQIICELEEAILNGGAAINALHDYERKVYELTEEKRTLQRELTRAKITENRVATAVVGHEWRDGNDKVIPLKRWLEERRFIQGEMQQLREKVALAERTAKAEEQLKDKFKLRLKVLEEAVRGGAGVGAFRSAQQNEYQRRASRTKGSSRCGQLVCGDDSARTLQSNGNNLETVLTWKHSVSSNNNTVLTQKETPQLVVVDGTINAASDLINSLSNEHVELKNGDNGLSTNTDIDRPDNSDSEHQICKEIVECNAGSDDIVSGVFYDILQREVIALRKACHHKDLNVKDKEDVIKVLSKKVDTLKRAMDVETKKMRREVAAREKEVASMRVEQDNRAGSRRSNITSKGPTNTSPRLPGRISRNSQQSSP